MLVAVFVVVLVAAFLPVSFAFVVLLFVTVLAAFALFALPGFAVVLALFAMGFALGSTTALGFARLAVFCVLTFPDAAFVPARAVRAAGFVFACGPDAFTDGLARFVAFAALARAAAEVCLDFALVSFCFVKSRTVALSRSRGPQWPLSVCRTRPHHPPSSAHRSTSG